MVAVGDKVSFLNDKLDGIVRTILSDTIAKVEITDGFVVDALIKELVVTEKFIADKKNTSEQVEVAAKTKKELFTVKENTIEFIASPAETHKVLTGGVSYFLSNANSFTLLYTLSVSERDKVKTISFGVLEPNSQKLLCSQSRESMFDWSHFNLQILITDDSQAHRPITKDLPVLLPDLNPTAQGNNTHSFSKYILLADFNVTEKVNVDELKDKFEKPIAPKKTFESPFTSLKSKGKATLTGAILLNSKEVDLHIEELTSDFSNMDNTAMINLQLQTVRKEMDAAILNNFKSIIFIHGVGNGKLKQALLEELKNYSNIICKNGSYEKYGNGATEVLF